MSSANFLRSDGIALAKLFPSGFFTSWKHICEAEKDLLIKLWHRRKEYTAKIFDRDQVVYQVADELGLKPYCGYYCIDAIFFEESGLVDCRPVGQTWVQRIRIAFEHEHSFCSGLYQEVSHLCITRADLRVLVTYPEGRDVTEEFKNLAKIVEAADLPATDQPFLIITGQKINADTDIEWIGYTYQAGEFLPLKS